jgi:type I restriction enzyme S subunit
MSIELTGEIFNAPTSRWKPYPAYKDSGVEWLGEVPEHWNITVLKRVCNNITDSSHFSPEIQYVGIPYVTVQDIKADYIDFDNCKRILEKDYLSLKKNGCQPNQGDVLLTKDGTIGKAIVIKEKQDFVIFSSLGMITPNQLKILSEYMKYYLISGINIDQMFSLIRGSALTRLTIKLIENLITVIPPLSEQQFIITYIDKETGHIDTITTKVCESISKLREYRTALISAAVTGKIDVRGVS